MTGCDMDHISGSLYAYSESNSVIPLYVQANEKSPIIKNLPSGTKVQVSVYLAMMGKHMKKYKSTNFIIKNVKSILYEEEIPLYLF